MRTGAGLRLLTVVSPVSAVARGRVSAREARITSVLAGEVEWSWRGDFHSKRPPRGAPGVAWPPS